MARAGQLLGVRPQHLLHRGYARRQAEALKTGCNSLPGLLQLQGGLSDLIVLCLFTALLSFVESAPRA
jgi:hypothetical protein